ncbi:hypothetical protein FSP39_001625 [Pinctada imbricata]|uniref:VWFC domain-containing protein n=1 Tax=Pinctada imbricata TaxID=66713 RepID=A0AA88Y2I9_PINIB|nr:hypothetical protein FSP39_001625 [Pinctada imbricata]
MRARLGFLVVLFAFVARGEERFKLPGHLVTVSRNLWSGERFKYCVTFPRNADLESGPVSELTVGITLTNQEIKITTHYDKVQFFSVDGESRCYDLTAPDLPGRYNFTANLTANFGSYIASQVYTSDATIHDSSIQSVTLVQTDKPLYKPGQMVKFRVMKLKKDFRPVFGLIPFVGIENPSGVRVMQWRNVDLSKGIASLEMQLSKDPPLGKWMIKVMFDKEITQIFEVEEYVLPKFEVTVTPPAYLLPSTSTIDGEVCGKYTYGQPVKGTLELKVCYERTWWGYWGGRSRDSNFQRPCAERILTINGCEKFSINASEIYLSSSRYSRYGKLVINATITEDGTGTVLKGQSKGPEMKFYPFELKMEDDTNNYFKSVFPYKGRVTAIRPDGSPAAGEIIQVSVEDYNWDEPWALKKDFVTDSNGKVEFSIEDVPENITRFSVQAKAIEYVSDYRTRTTLQLYQPSAYMYVRRWFSPSESFIQIEDVTEPVKCGQDLRLGVLYSTPPDSRYKMHVIVTEGSEMVYTNHHTHHFKIHDAVNFETVDKSSYLERYFPTRPPPFVQPPLPPLIPINITSDDNETEPVPVVEDPIVPEIYFHCDLRFYVLFYLKEVQPLILNRRRRQTSGCVDMDGKTVAVDDIYKPDSTNPCKTCVCSDTDEEETCFTAMCVPPTCPNYKMREKECCAWDCLDENGNVIPPMIPEVEPPPPPPKGDGCLDKDNNLIADGDVYHPNKSNVCQSCVCNKGQPERCAMIMCDAPPCPYYKLIEGTCCGFTCLDTPEPPEPPVLQKNNHIARMYLTIPITSAMAPRSKVMVYYVRDDMETVATSREFTVEKCLDNQVKLEFEEVSVKPGMEATMKLQAEPGSVCSVGTVDKSMQIMKPDHEMTAEKFYKLVSQYQPYYYYSSWQDNRKYCEEQLKEEVEKLENDTMIHYSFNTESVDSIEAFRSLQLMVLSNLRVQTRPCTIRTYRRYNNPVPMFSSRTRNRGMPGLSGENGVSIDRSDVVVSAGSVEAVVDKAQKKVRSFFPETWLWEIEVVGDTGEIMLKRKVPDTITEWIGNSVCVSSTAGIGISQPTALRAFQPFFLSFTLPYSAVRGEVVPVLVTVFNYMSESLTVELERSPDFDLQVSAATKYDCIHGGESSTFKFDITPKSLGKIKINASAISITDNGFCGNNVVQSTEAIGASDAVSRELLIEIPPGSLEETSINLALPTNIVPDSARGFVSVIGDVMGPALSNLQDLLRMPYGCGEQNMASFAPNIFALQYLNNTNQQTKSVVEEAKRYMRVGYQRQLKYRHPDGSYSAWGGSGDTSGSMWLTAFVIKCLGQSRPYIEIDEKDLNKSIAWFKRRQLETGCFPKIGYTHSYYLKGGFADRSNEAVMTSFVLIAMMEAGVPRDDQVVLDGIRCLDIQPLEDTYSLAVMAYAYSLYKVSHPRRRETIYWERQKDEDENVTVSPYRWFRAPSAEIEITSYALLANIVNNQSNAAVNAKPIVMWLSRQRNSLGGFGSTQDTIVALQALSRYASLVYQKGVNIMVQMSGTGFTSMFEINDKNTLLLQSKEFSKPIPDSLICSVAGKGCAFIQASVKYNIPDEPTGPAFDLTTKIYRSKDHANHCAKRTLNICVKFTGQGGVSNMAIVDVKMQTGWIPVKDSLKKLLQKSQNGGPSQSIDLQKYETDGNMVHLYFDQLDTLRRCFYFDVEQNIEVTDPKPAFVKVYDYYETDLSVTKQYDIRTTCGTKEELPYLSLEEYAYGLLNTPVDEIAQFRLPSGRLPSPRGKVLILCFYYFLSSSVIDFHFACCL